MPPPNAHSGASEALSFVKRAFYVCAYTGFALFFGYVALVMSWAGRRPLKPDAAHPYPFNNHGVIFVSSSDLWGSRGVLVSALVLVAAALAMKAWIRRFDPSFDRRGQRGSPR